MVKKPAVISQKWELELFINDATPRSAASLYNVKAAVDRYLPGGYHLKVVDIIQEPAQAKINQIVATPTLIKVSPSPRRVLVGDFTNLDCVLGALHLGPARG